MRAYNLAMAQIFFSCAFGILNSVKIGATNTSIFGMNYGNHTGVFWELAFLTNPLFSISGFSVSLITVFASTLAIATIIVFNTNITGGTAQGISYSAFAIIFWGAFISAVAIFNEFDIPGLEVFLLIYTLASTLIFFVALIQMPTGGQKTYV